MKKHDILSGFTLVLSYLHIMDIRRILNGSMATLTQAGDLFTMAKANWVLDSTYSYLYMSEIAQNATTVFQGSAVAGTSAPAANVQPDYYPVATKGAEAGCIVSTLSWADKNLEEGYEWVALATGKYFVSGVMNSSQTLANDPFDAAKGGSGIIAPANWDSNYAVGVNPF